MLEGFGSRLRLARESAGLSMRELGERIGAGHAIIGRCERGERLPRLQDVAKLSEALGVRIGWLTAGESPMRGRAVAILVEDDGPDSVGLRKQLLIEADRIQARSQTRNRRN
jgi:transcriptional regulator with XRE-family HTH domain